MNSPAFDGVVREMQAVQSAHCDALVAGQEVLHPGLGVRRGPACRLTTCKGWVLIHAIDEVDAPGRRRERMQKADDVLKASRDLLFG